MADRLQPGWPPLLELIWPRDDVRAEPIPDMLWPEIASAAKQHRIGPLLHVRTRAHAVPVPSEIAEIWAYEHRQSSIRALKQKAELSRIFRWLEEAKISAVVLKGGALIWRGWFDPALRPMRDLDILVPRARAPDAQDLLLSKGFTARTAAPDSVKHLPGLIAPESDLLIELHFRLIDALTAEWKDRDERFVAAARARARKLPAAQGGFTVFADEDTLLHVIVHSVLDNQFNNGPFSLLDIEMLISHGDIDWQRFWSLAAQAGCIRAAQLAFKLAETILPNLAVDWQGHAPTALEPSAIMGAANLMFVPVPQRTELGFIGRLFRFNWTEQPRILIGGLVRHHKTSNTAPAYSAPNMLNRIGNMSSKAGRGHIRQSLDVAKWLRE